MVDIKSVIIINCLLARKLDFFFLYISLFAVLLNNNKKEMLTIAHLFYDSKIFYNQVSVHVH